MSILWSAAEKDEFETISGTVANVAGNCRTGYGRAAISIGSGGYVIHALGADYTDIWLSFRKYSANWAAETVRFGGLMHSGGTKIAVVGGASSYISIVKYDGATQTVLATGTTAPAIASHVKFDLQVIDLDGGATTTVNLYIDGALYATYTGDLSALAPHIDGVSFASNGSCYLTEVIVADESTLRMSLVTLPPDGAVSSTWDGGAYTDVDEIIESTSDVLSSGTAAQEFLCDVGGLPAGTFDVRAVKVVARASKGTTGPTQLSLGVEQGGTTEWDTAQALATSYAAYESWWTTNPDTAVAFTPTELETLRIGVKSVA
jgi:hypothetical protein